MNDFHSIPRFRQFCSLRFHFLYVYLAPACLDGLLLRIDIDTPDRIYHRRMPCYVTLCLIDVWYLIFFWGFVTCMFWVVLRECIWFWWPWSSQIKSVDTVDDCFRSGILLTTYSSSLFSFYVSTVGLCGLLHVNMVLLDAYFHSLSNLV